LISDRDTSGKNFVAATIKVRDGGAVQFWRALAFSGDTQSELMRLDDGDALSVRGGLKLVDNFPALDRLSVNRRRGASRRPLPFCHNVPDRAVDKSYVD
jgi:hypothetical protein